jgi:hypothetical protein
LHSAKICFHLLHPPPSFHWGVPLIPCLLSPAARCWTLSPDLTALLDNKAHFSDYAASLGLSVPHHHVVSSPAQLHALNNGPEVSISHLQRMETHHWPNEGPMQALIE